MKQQACELYWLHLCTLIIIIQPALALSMIPIHLTCQTVSFKRFTSTLWHEKTSMCLCFVFAIKKTNDFFHPSLWWFPCLCGVVCTVCVHIHAFCICRFKHLKSELYRIIIYFGFNWTVVIKSRRNKGLNKRESIWRCRGIYEPNNDYYDLQKSTFYFYLSLNPLIYPVTSVIYVQQTNTTLWLSYLVYVWEWQRKRELWLRWCKICERQEAFYSTANDYKCV